MKGEDVHQRVPVAAHRELGLGAFLGHRPREVTGPAGGADLDPFAPYAEAVPGLLEERHRVAGGFLALHAALLRSALRSSL